MTKRYRIWVDKVAGSTGWCADVFDGNNRLERFIDNKRDRAVKKATTYIAKLTADQSRWLDYKGRPLPYVTQPAPPRRSFISKLLKRK